MLAYEPLVHETSADGVTFLGIESIRQAGAWPSLRHVFDLDRDAGLYVELDPLAGLRVLAVGFDRYGDERLTPL